MSSNREGLCVAGLVGESLQPTPKIAEERVVTHRIDRVHKMPPHLFVAFRKVALLVMLAGDVADVLYAQECIFVRFCRHVKNLTAIFATRSTVLPVVKRFILAAGALLSWPCCEFLLCGSTATNPSICFLTNPDPQHTGQISRTWLRPSSVRP